MKHRNGMILLRLMLSTVPCLIVVFLTWVFRLMSFSGTKGNLAKEVVLPGLVAY